MPFQIKFETILLDKKSQPIEQFERKSLAAGFALQHQVADILEKAMEKRMKGWSRPPKINRKLEYLAKSIRLDVSPRAGGRWEWLTLGVKSHFIVPRRAKILRFRANYSPRTKPGNIYGGSGKRSGDVIYTGIVTNWPGIKPREFEKHIIEEEEDKIFDILQKAIERA